MARLTHSEYLEKVRQSRGTDIKVIGRYVTYQKPIEHRCVCGEVWRVTPNNVISGQKCNNCRVGPKKRSQDDYTRALRKVHGTRIVCLGEYVTSGTKLPHKCTICQKVWETTPYHMLKTQCSQCRGGELEKTHRANLKEKHGVNVRLLEMQYGGRTAKPKYQCMLCKYIYRTTRALAVAGTGCPHCAVDNCVNGGNKLKTVRVAGKKFQVQGYEERALRWLVEVKKIPVKSIQCHEPGMPRIIWHEKGKTRRHFPDIYVPSTNRIYEVKSKNTLGLKPFRYGDNGAKRLRGVQRKAVEAKKAGFKYTLLLLDKHGKRIKMPKGWTQMSFRALKKALTTARVGARRADTTS